jgi:hypothetical protein
MRLIKVWLIGFMMFLVPEILEGKYSSTHPPVSRCHVFIDQKNIWTLETIVTPGEEIIPILNIITLSPGKWEFRPRQIHIFNKSGSRAHITKMAMDTGPLGESYLTTYLFIRGNSLIGLELLGNFNNFAEPANVLIDLEKNQFRLKPIDCVNFEHLTKKINRINLNSPNIWEDFEILQINPLGSIDPQPQQH